jgi:hypothetical protein
MLELSQADIERFWSRVDRSGGPEACWFWVSSTTRGNGFNRRLRVLGSSYGIFTLANGLQCSAHRLSYIMAKGPIPEGLYILHECDVPACVNPAHLKAGTQSENISDAWKRGRFKPRSLFRWTSAASLNQPLVRKGITIQLPVEIAQQIKALAKTQYRTFQQQLLYMINNSLEAERRRAGQDGERPS